jgi:hypothetical protein
MSPSGATVAADRAPSSVPDQDRNYLARRRGQAVDDRIQPGLAIARNDHTGNRRQALPKVPLRHLKSGERPGHDLHHKPPRAIGYERQPAKRGE